MSKENSVVAVFASHDKAEDAVRKLQKSGFDMKKLSIVGKDYHTDEHVVGYYSTGDRMMYWGKWGAFWGGLWGCCSVRRSFGFPASGRCWLPGHWQPRSSARWKMPPSSVDSARSGQGFTAWASPRIACFNTKRPSRRAIFCSSPTERPQTWREQRASLNRPTPQPRLRMSPNASLPVPERESCSLAGEKQCLSARQYRR